MTRTQLKRTKAKKLGLRTEMSLQLKQKDYSSSTRRRRNSSVGISCSGISTFKEFKFKVFYKKNCKRRLGKKLTSLSTKSFLPYPKSAFTKKKVASCDRLKASWNEPCVKPRSRQNLPKKLLKLQRNRLEAIVYGLPLMEASGTRICTVLRLLPVRMASSSRILGRS